MFSLKKNEERAVIAVIVLLLIIIAAYRIIVFKSDSVKVVKADAAVQESQTIKADDKIYVYITGEVMKPDVYELKEGDRIIDAINAAKGFTAEADTAWVNLAGKLKDEQYINVPKKNTNNPQENTSMSAIKGGKININIATVKEIDEFLPGIGETYANNIVNYRNKNGRFSSVDELTKVEGIGKGKRFESIKDLIIVN